MVRERMRVERECVRDVRDVYDMSYVLVKERDYQQEPHAEAAAGGPTWMRVIVNKKIRNLQFN